MTYNERKIWLMIAESTQDRILRALYFQLAEGKTKFLQAVINMQ